MFNNIKFFIGACAIFILLTACSSTAKKSKELARVAKDWSLVIRASQVIPIYPLSEDVRPGDVFLVQTPIKDQVKQFEDDGFLPMDQLISRLQPDGYDSFYAPTTINSNQFSPFLTATHLSSNRGNPFPTNAAPRASFPSYNFSFSRGGGLKMALPISGVPVALGVTGFQKAQGSVTLSDAYTYGIDLMSLSDQLDEWAATHQISLKRIAAETQNTTNYVRIVNRVYLVSQVNVSLSDAKASGFSASGGANKNVHMLDLSTDSSTNYSNILAQLNASAADAAAPGGSVKFASASSRSVSLSETFPRPLVVGYLGYDRPILKDGTLGNAIPTKSLLNKESLTVNISSFANTDRLQRERISKWLTTDPNNFTSMNQWLATRNIGMPAAMWVNANSTKPEDLMTVINDLNIPTE